MLTEKEKRIIRRYCLLPALGAAFLCMAMLIGAVLILLCMVNDLVFYGDFYSLGLYTYLAIAAVYTVAFIFCFLIPRIGMGKQKWKEISRKANASLNSRDFAPQVSAALGIGAAGSLLSQSQNPKANRAVAAMKGLAAAGAAAAAVDMAGEMSRNARLTAEVCGVQIPRAKNYVTAVVLLPILLLTAVYIPHFVAARQRMEAEIAVASESVYALQAALQEGCDRVYADDPREEYDSGGYRVSGYLYGYDSPLTSYIYVIIDNEGFVSEVSYAIDLDIQEDKEESILKAETELAALHQLLNSAGLPARAEELLADYALPEAFISQFMAGSYYESITYAKSDNTWIYYMTDSEDEYDEYSSSYIYVSIDS
ncbi:MAG: hypothetical protein LUE21_06820 [Oscillospiraceae bacterium]|nr:hypothetical protein [Oscillospiraceae bacterium]